MISALSRTMTTSLPRALGRIPSGLFIVTTVRAGQPVGFLGSLVQQVGFAPPTLSLAVAKDREPLVDLRSAGRFTLSILDTLSRPRMALFLKRPASGLSPYEELATARAPSGLPYLTESLAWLDCRVIGEHEVSDHVVFFATVEAGAQLREGDPHVHLRRNGLSY